MREVKVLAWCDVCAMEDGRTEATHTYTVGLVQGETKPALKVLEVCDRHDKLAAELAGILAGIGQQPALPPVKAKPTGAGGRPRSAGDRDATGRLLWQCPLCRRDIPSNTAVAHVWNNHRRDVKPPAPTSCPDCELADMSAQAMAQHRRTVHGYDALADALAGAR